MIVLGADVGKTTGLALVDCSGSKPRLVKVTLAREEVVPAFCGLLDLLASQGWQLQAVGIETPAQVFEHGRAAESEGARRSIERALLVARDAAGQVRAVAGMQGRPINVHDGQAHHVRRAVLGKLPREHLDRFIAERLPLLVDGWPKVSNSHERDAAVVALWAWQRERAGLKPSEVASRRKAPKRPSALDLRDAYLAVAKGQPGAIDNVRAMLPRQPRRDRAELAAMGAAMQRQGQEMALRKPDGDPGEERAAAMLADCPTCGRLAGAPCARLPGASLLYGVHTLRAMDAGVAGHGEAKAAALAKLSATGPRKLATVKPPEAWVRLPWAPMCVACGGARRCSDDGPLDSCGVCVGLGVVAVRWPALDGADPPAAVPMRVPEKHREHSDVCTWPGWHHGKGEPACSGCGGGGRTGKCKMIRRAWTRGGVRCWLYEPA